MAPGLVRPSWAASFPAVWSPLPHPFCHLPQLPQTPIKKIAQWKRKHLLTVVHHQPLYSSCVPGSTATWRALSLSRCDDLRGLTFSKPRFPRLWNGLITCCLNWHLNFLCMFMLLCLWWGLSVIIQVRCLVQFWYHDKSKLVKEEEENIFFLTSFSSAKLGFCVKSPSGGIPPALQNPKRRWAALCPRERKQEEVP